MTSKGAYGRKTISVVVPTRIRGPEHPFGADGIRLLEEVIADACALAGIDAMAPVRRDVGIVIRRPPRKRRR
jgi:hypothetical protein